MLIKESTTIKNPTGPLVKTAKPLINPPKKAYLLEFLPPFVATDSCKK